MFSRLAQLFKPKPEQPPATARIEPLGVEVPVTKGRTILDAALDKSVPFPNNCRVGGCGTCRCRLVEGEVKQLTDSSYVLSAEEIAGGWILGCQSVPRSASVTVEVPGLGDPALTHPVVTTHAAVSSLKSLTHDILELTLKLDAPITFTAGQSADLSVPGVTDAPRSYSFARWHGGGATTAPVFHVRKVLGGQFTTWLHEKAKVGDAVHFSGPKGSFHLRPGSGPMLFIAGGSGLAPVLAMLEQAADEGVQRDARFYFGARTQRDLYAVADIERVARDWKRKFEFVPMLSEEPEGTSWKGRRGLVTEGIDDLGAALTEHHAWLCGPPGMIDAAVSKLTSSGLNAERVSVDRFTDRSHTHG